MTLRLDTIGGFAFDTPVVTVHIIQPTALLDRLDHPRQVLPGGKAVQLLILLSRTGDHTTEGPLTL